MKRILGITICLAFAISVWGQSSGNPFDLRFRKPKPAEAIEPHLLKDTIPVATSLGSSDSIGTALADSIPPAGSTPPSKENDSIPADPSNPFEKKGDAGVSAPEFSHPEAPVISPDTPSDKVPVILRQKSFKGFQIFFILLSLLFLIFIVNVERSFVRDLWRVISNENYSSLHHRNQRNTMRQILLLMGYAVFIMQTGLFLYFVLRYFRHEGDVFTNIWTTIAFVLGVYLVRHAVIRYLRWLFNNDKEMTLFGFDISIFNTMVGLILLPVNILLIFGPDSVSKPLIIIGIVAICVAYLMRQLRWLLTARSLITHSLFLFFVYLCAVEILPLWAISKLFW